MRASPKMLGVCEAYALRLCKSYIQDLRWFPKTQKITSWQSSMFPHSSWIKYERDSIKGEKRLATSICRFSNPGYWVMQKGYIEMAGKKAWLSYLGKSPTGFSRNFASLQKAAYFTHYFYSGSFPVVQSVFQNKWCFCVQSGGFGPAWLLSVPSTLYGSC